MSTIKSDLWVEKYRPKKLDDIYGQEEIIKQLKSYLILKNIPHLLFVGSPGVGKTATAIALAKELYESSFTNNFLELNASDERGIDTVRTKIKNFSKTAPSNSISFKIIFLDEADALTIDAQTALRRIMEHYSSNCRFILTCNYFNKIIEPLKSRCMIYNFRLLTFDSMKKYIENILHIENIDVSNEFLKAIISKSNGDLRKALTLLQSSLIHNNNNIIENNNLLYSSINYDNYIETFKNIISNVLSGNFKEANSETTKLQFEIGISSSEIVSRIHSIIYSFQIPDEKLAIIISLIGDYEYRISVGSNELIQLETLLAKLSLLKINV